MNLIEDIKTNNEIGHNNEEAIKQGVILRLLSLLGWDPFNTDEIAPEYSVGGRRVDYSLRVNSSNKVFIEVKRASEELENHQKQFGVFFY